MRTLRSFLLVVVLASIVLSFAGCPQGSGGTQRNCTGCNPTVCTESGDICGNAGQTGCASLCRCLIVGTVYSCW